MENLQTEGQSMVQNLIENWPDKAPTVTRLALFVRADQTELWRLWATSQFPNIEVVVHGTQHFSMSSTKNSADIAIATSAMADLLLQRVSHVVVFSDDSDFISLYIAIRNESGISRDDSKAPFLWVGHGPGGLPRSYGQAIFSHVNCCTWWRLYLGSKKIARLRKPLL